MTKEEAWLAWMKAAKTTDTPIETDFELIKKASWWQAFEAGWDLASVNLNGWDQAYAMGFEAGKREWVGLPSDDEILEMSKDVWGRGELKYSRDDHRPFYVDFARAIEAKLKEKNT